MSGRGQSHKTTSSASNGIEMANGKLTKGDKKKKDKATHKNDADNDKSDADVSYDLPNVTDVSTIKELEKKFEEKIKYIEAKNEAKLEALYKVINQKDEVIGRLNIEIGELKRSVNFLTNETSEIKKALQITQKL